ncbi:MAG TPA: pirin family protein [Vitreimonas sp.]|nr:pirin family protein [Vitreimonas sp.]
MLKIARTTEAMPKQGGSPTHQNRLVVAPADYANQSPFLLMAEDWFAPPSGFPTHPHRGMETVTFVLDGALEHRDHTGAHGVLGAGDVQFMTAGGGVMHSEMPAPGGVHSLQLWLNLPARLKRTKARYADRKLDAARVDVREGVTARFYADAGSQGSVWPLTLIDVSLETGAHYDAPIPAKARTFVYVLEGEAEVGGASLRAGQVGWADPVDTEDTLPLSSPTKARALIYASEPINEPVVAGGPFVMNTEAEIHEAFADLRAGRLTA